MNEQQKGIQLMDDTQYLKDSSELCLYCKHYEQTDSRYGICHNPKSPFSKQETNMADNCDYHETTLDISSY